MDGKRTRAFIAISLAACVAVGVAAYFAGSSVAAAEYDGQRNLDITLNRSELEMLQLVDGPVYVTGHASPDSDTICSAIAFARLLSALGYDAQPVALGDVNDETDFILEYAGVEEPPLLEDASACNIVLVDHSNYEQSADGLADANVIAIVDHHGDGSVTTGNPLVYDARPLGSTATIIWMRYRNYGIDLDSQTATLLLGALLSDTSNLHSDMTTSADREACKILGELAGIDDLEAFYQDMYKASISYKGMTDEEILASDMKQYSSGGKTFAIGCINVYDEKEAAAMAARMQPLLSTNLKELGIDMEIVQISIFHDDVSVTYLVPSDEAAAEAIETAFGDQLEFDGTSYILKPGVSRRQVLAPALTDVLAMHPTE